MLGVLGVEGGECLWGLVGRWWRENWLLFWIHQAVVAVPSAVSADLARRAQGGSAVSAVPLGSCGVSVAVLWASAEDCGGAAAVGLLSAGCLLPDL